MSRIRGKNTTPEMRARSLLHQLGYRFRLHVRIPIHAKHTAHAKTFGRKRSQSAQRFSLLERGEGQGEESSGACRLRRYSPAATTLLIDSPHETNGLRRLPLGRILCQPMPQPGCFKSRRHPEEAVVSRKEASNFISRANPILPTLRLPTSTWV